MSIIPPFLRRKKKKKTRPRTAPAMQSTRAESSAQPRRKKAPEPTWKERVLMPLLWRVGITGGLIGAVVTVYFFSTLPNIDDLNKFTKTPSIVLKSEDGQIIGSFGDVYGDYVPFTELPNSLIDAVIATEDRNYYHHFGLDPLGLLRATIANIRAGHVVQGGSTITQQVAKNVFLTSERSMGRKLREMFLAIKLERRFTKEDILSIYLNRVYLGAGSYGVDAAARRYFDKSARELTLSESAIIAGLLKAPSRYAPTSNPTRSRKRADQVLLNMLDAGFLTKAQTDKAIAELAKSMGKRKPHTQSSLYFADWIVDQLPEYLGTVNDDLVVTTTLKPEWQALGDKAITEVMDKESEKSNAHQAALMAMSPDGAVRVMIGGRSYAESQFNRATQAQRQPGSSFKLFVYLAGLEAGYTPDTIVEDQPVIIGKWQPKNYNGKYLGDMPLRQAVAESINTVAVQVSETAGLGRVIEMARRLGITGDLDPLHSIALGSVESTLLEMTNAYAHLASGGQIVNPYGIVEIDNSRGETLYRREASRGTGQVLSGNTVGMMNELLMGVTTQGTGRGAQIGRPIAGKTGTTSDYKDAWFIGYSPDLVAGVWVGNDDNESMKKVTGGNLPAQIWKSFMAPALAGTPARGIPTGYVTPWHAPDEPTRGNNPQRPEPSQRPKDSNLGNSFWDKLLGSDAARDKVEYSYPSQR